MDDLDEDTTIKTAKRSKLENNKIEIEFDTKSKNIASSSRILENPHITIPDDLPDLIPMDTTKEENNCTETNSKIPDNADNNTIQLKNIEILPYGSEMKIANLEKLKNTEPIKNEKNNDIFNEKTEQESTSNQICKNRNNPMKKRNYQARRISSSSSNSSSYTNPNILDSSNSSNNESYINLLSNDNLIGDSNSKIGSNLGLNLIDSDNEKNSSAEKSSHDEDIKSAKRSKLENDKDEINMQTISQNITSSSILENLQIPDDLPDLIPMDTTKEEINSGGKKSEISEKPVKVSDDTIQLNNNSLTNNENLPNESEINVDDIEKKPPENTEPIENENNDVILGSEETEAGTSNQIRNVTRRNRNNPIKKRNYRARRISSSSSSSNSSTHSNPNILNSSTTSVDDSSSSSSTESYISLPLNYMLSDDDTHSNTTGSILSLNLNDSDDDDDDDEQDSTREQLFNGIHELLLKDKPNYTMNLAYEVMCREHGLSGIGFSDRNKFNKKNNSILFQNRVCSSRNMIEKMKLMHNLKKHRGCVNSLNFNNTGELLCTGSDDLKICVWNWSANKLIYSFHSGHHSNVFQTKFINNNNTSTNNGLNIISSGRDGEIRHAIIPPSGNRLTKVNSTILFKHSGGVHKIALCPTNYNEILTAGEDGHIVRCDLREKPIERIVTVKVNKRKVPLYSIAHHPLDPEFCVCGREQYVRVYDKRNPKIPIYKMSPEHLHDKKAFICHVTCAVYNQTGTEILASYSDEDIFLFNTKCYIPGNYLNRYTGRSNNKTIKGVNFFGPNSEYVISGSDCGNIFMWDKETETIINWMKGDKSGIVNCLEPHPSFPILATSGLDYDAKIWAPISGTDPPSMEGLEKCVRNNMKRPMITNDDEIFDDRTFFFFVRQCMRNRRPTGNGTEDCPTVPNIESSSDDDELDSDSNCTGDPMGQLPCRTQ